MDGSRQPGFLEKLLGPLPGQATAPDRYTGDAIGVHLNLLLNTRRGSVPHLRHPDAPERRRHPRRKDAEPVSDYGMPDVGSFYPNYPSSMEHLRQEIEALVRNYEPRLANPRVYETQFDEREFRVSFLIEGEIANEDQVTRVRYRTVIDRDGQAQLSSPRD